MKRIHSDPGVQWSFQYRRGWSIRIERPPRIRINTKNKLKKWLQRIQAGKPCGQLAVPWKPAAFGAIWGRPNRAPCNQATTMGPEQLLTREPARRGAARSENLRSSGNVPPEELHRKESCFNSKTFAPIASTIPERSAPRIRGRIRI